MTDINFEKRPQIGKAETIKSKLKASFSSVGGFRSSRSSSNWVKSGHPDKNVQTIKDDKSDQFVPFPESIHTEEYKDLENIVVRMGEDRLPTWEDLPDSFSAGPVEGYVNWLQILSQNDPLQRERGTIVPVAQSMKKIIFPAEPAIGTDNMILYKNVITPTNAVRVLDVHSHPSSNYCYSNAFGDLGMLLVGEYEGQSDFLPKGMIVSGKDFNFALLKTTETPHVSDRYDVFDEYDSRFDYREYSDFERRGTEFGKNHDDSSFWSTFHRADETRFKHGFLKFYHQYIDTFNTANVYKLGFYWSNKDGIYHRYTREQLLDHVRGELQQALVATEIRKELS